MPRNWMLLSCILLLGSAATSAAHPLDSPDIVYINGQPCNSLCQSYMAWSRKASSMSGRSAAAQPAPLPPKAAARQVTGAGIRGEKSRPAAHVRVAKQRVPKSKEMPQAGIAGLQPADKAAADSDTTRAKIADSHPAGDAAAGSDATPEKIADAHPTGDAAAGSNILTIRAQVMAATAVAERITVATAVSAPEPKANETALPKDTEKDTEKSTSAPPEDTDRLVAVVMAGPEIKSISDLANKNIAVDDKQSAYSASVQTAIAAAGAAEVQLSEGQTKAAERLVGGEVPAAVLALVSPEAAEGFPEIAGFRIFRIPLSPRASKARL
jgi:hypothetical protein